MNRKGSAIVEAAMVFPVMFLSIIAVLYMLIYFYNQVENQIELHMMLRSENGAICNNMYYDNQLDDNLSVYRKGTVIYSYSTTTMADKGLLKGREKQIYAEKYIINEVMVIRMADLTEIEGVGDE